jgi:hypothetical protein
MLATSNVRAENSPAASASEAPTTVAPDKPARVWYGEPALLCDGIALVMYTGALTTTLAADPRSEPVWVPLLLSTSVGPYLGGSILHASRGHGGRAVASLGIRAALPLLTALIGSAIATQTGHGDIDGYIWRGSSAGLIVGLGFGAAGAIAIDDFVLAYDDPPKPSSSTSSFFIAPTVTPIHNGASVGVVGMF